MSDLDVDIRSVGNAAYGSRTAMADLGATQQSAPEQAAPSATSDNNAAASAISDSLVQFRYDSFRFVYKPDYGRIVLIDQSPMTGEPIAQIPSQRVLELYAEQRRSEAKAALMAGEGGEQVTASAGRGRRMTASTVSPVALSVASMPALPAAQIAAVSASPANPVNITI